MSDFTAVFHSVTNTAYTFLLVNMLMTATCWPVILLVTVTDLGVTWLWLAILLPITGFATLGAFEAFHQLAEGQPLRAYLHGCLGQSLRLLPIALSCGGAAVILAVDVAATREVRLLAVGIGPVLALILVAVAALGPLCVILLERPDLSRRSAARAALQLTLANPGWAAVSVMAVAVLGVMILVQPVLACGVAASPCLYIVWSGSRRVVSPALPASSPDRDDTPVLINA